MKNNSYFIIGSDSSFADAKVFECGFEVQLPPLLDLHSFTSTDSQAKLLCDEIEIAELKRMLEL